jgi:hypothetical protein
MSKQQGAGLLVFVVGLLIIAASLVSGHPGEHSTRSGDLSVEKSERRCGWFSNPTPSNASLYDRDGEWIISVQGGHQADGDWPDFGPRQWIETNVHYGYGCACLQLQVNRSTHRVIAIESSKARPLSVCRNDRKLKRWGFK